jgi:hypothetical protein
MISKNLPCRLNWGSGVRIKPIAVSMDRKKKERIKNHSDFGILLCNSIMMKPSNPAHNNVRSA